MDELADTDAAFPRQPSRGRTFVYVLPCRDEDILKVGFSRDPVQRLRTLHRRFFEVFDLERALLLETDHLRDARAIERRLITEFAEHRAPAPLVVRRAARGDTEWFRGVAPQVEAMAEQTAARDGWPLHRPLSVWLRERFVERADLLFDWSSRMLESIQYARFNEPSGVEALRLGKALREALDAWSGVGMDVRQYVPGTVFDWYESARWSAVR